MKPQILDFYAFFFVYLEFRQKVPHDPEDLFWTHFELLRKCKMVAVRGQSSDDEDDDQTLFRKAPKIGGNKSVKLLKSYCK